MRPFEDSIVEQLKDMVETQRKIASDTGNPHEMRRHLFYLEMFKVVEGKADWYRKEKARQNEKGYDDKADQLAVAPRPDHTVKEGSWKEAVAKLKDGSSWDLLHQCDEERPCCSFTGMRVPLLVFGNKAKAKL
jgi:hypothetical protein